MLVVTVLVDGGDQEALGAKEAICNLLERFGSVRALQGARGQKAACRTDRAA